MRPVLLTFFMAFAICYSSQSADAQTKSSARNKSWSPLSGTGLQHALANASRRHFDKRPVPNAAAMSGRNKPVMLTAPVVGKR